MPRAAVLPLGIGGLQTLGRLRELAPEVRAVVSSGYSEDEVMASYRSHGFLAMVSNPYSIEEIARVLRPLFALSPTPTELQAAQPAALPNFALWVAETVTYFSAR
ncbi:MAG TPA: hypothetical protein VK178_13690 [Opitutaceae bacterium]|nr:hypothetical protein [Opitutaceae bacterium]